MRPSLARRSFSWLLVLVPIAGSGGCGPNGGTDAGSPPILDPEPAGAPVDPAGGQLACLGDNLPPPGTGASVELTGYVRAFANVDNTMGTCCCAGVCGPCAADCMVAGACCDRSPAVTSGSARSGRTAIWSATPWATTARWSRFCARSGAA